jgi:hypothetical protein
MDRCFRDCRTPADTVSVNPRDQDKRGQARFPERCDMTTPEEVTVRRFDANGSEIAVFEFQGELRDLILSSLRKDFLATGSYFADGKTVSSQGVLSMAVAGAATVGTLLSASLSSTLFMATANPATLMSLGAGVGSAVMGVNGIVAQAPFIAVASSLPVVAPIMAMQALNAIVMLQQFKQVDRKLNAIKGSIDIAIARAEATHAGELLTAAEIVDEVYRQYEQAGSFSNDMLIRLALAEHDARRLAERFRFLVNTHAIGDIDDIADVQRANYDAHSAMLGSFLDLRIAYLRVCVDMQENPKSLDYSLDQLKDKIRSGTDFWQQMVNRSESFRNAISEREKLLSDMNWVERSLPEFAGGKGASASKKLAALKGAYVVTLESELTIVKGFDSLIQSAKETLHSLENPKTSLSAAPTMVYWKDETGEHSFSTEKLMVS